MMAVLSFIARQIGFVGYAVIALLAYYEGVPWLRDIPGIAYVPIAREIVVGRVQKVAADAVKNAVADMVHRAELTVAKELIAELRRQNAIKAQLADEAQKQAASARAETEVIRSALEREIDEDRDPDIGRWRERDLERLRTNRARGPP